MRRVAFLIMVFAFSALAWPAAAASAHSLLYVWVNADDCEVVVRLGSHTGSEHTHASQTDKDWVRYIRLGIFPLEQEKHSTHFFSFQRPGANDVWTTISLRDTPVYADYSADTTWQWEFVVFDRLPSTTLGRSESIGFSGISREHTGIIPAHCVTPPPPTCQFSGGFGDWAQRHSDAGACHNNELYVGRGSLQSTKNGVLFFDSDTQRLEFFKWERVWQALVSVPFSEPRPWSIYDPQPGTGVSALDKCRFPGVIGDWAQQYSNAGTCYNVEQHVGGGSLQSAKNGILFNDSGRHRVGFIDWERVWHALATMPKAEPQTDGTLYLPSETSSPTTARCRFAGGFGEWIRQNPIAGTCHTNELHLSGGSIQPTENGILFYNSVSQGLEFFDWVRAWQALRSLPTLGPQTWPTLDTQAEPGDPSSIRCQYSAGYLDWREPRSPSFNSHPNYWVRESQGLLDWISLREVAGQCHNKEQFVQGGVIQSAQNGIIFYDRENLQLELFDWAHIWQALAAMHATNPQPSSVPETQAVTAVPTATQCQFILGFAHWAQTSPGVGACHNNELSVTGGSLQSTQNGILFYDRDNQRLAFFNWAQVRQAVAPLPFTQPQLPPTTETQTAAHCQFVLGFANWVQQHADAGACLNSEQFLASGSVQSTQNGILFYDSGNQRLGFFDWERVWQGLALLASSQ